MFWRLLPQTARLTLAHFVLFASITALPNSLIAASAKTNGWLRTALVYMILHRAHDSPGIAKVGYVRDTVIFPA
jgi:hypothetical protein